MGLFLSAVKAQGSAVCRALHRFILRYGEFPGGKVESGETPEEAAVRVGRAAGKPEKARKDV